jgi:hypothetical protein
VLDVLLVVEDAFAELVGARVVDGALILDDAGLLVDVGRAEEEGPLVEGDAGIVLVLSVVLLTGFPPLAQYDTKASSTL